MGEVRFRTASPEDAGDILRIKRAAIESIDSGDYTEDQLFAWRPDDKTLPTFERAIESDRFVVLVAEVGEDIGGYGVLSGETNRIDALFVHPDTMGTGLGSSLVRQFEMRTQMRGYDELDIISSLNAISFYRRLDYEQVGTRTRPIDGQELDFAVMRKSLSVAGE